MRLRPNLSSRWLCAALMLLLGTLRGAAEEVQDDPPFQAFSPDAARRAVLLDLEGSEPDPPLEPPIDGIALGKLLLLPKLEQTVTFTDNSLRTRRNPLSDFVSLTTGTVGLTYNPLANIRLDFSIAEGWTEYLENTAQNHLTTNINAGLNARDLFTKGLEFSFTEHYYQSGNSDLLDNEFLQFSRYETNDAQARVRYAYNRFSLTTTVRDSLAHYFKPTNLVFDFKTETLDVEAAYTVLPERFVVFFDTQRSWCRKPYDEHDDFDSQTYKGGIRGSWEKLNYSVSFGYDEAKLTNGTNPARDGAAGPAFSALISYKPQERLRLTLNGDRHFFPSPFLRFSTETDLRAATEIRLTRSTHLNLEAIRNENKVLRGIDVVRSGYRATMDWRLNQPVVFTWGASHVNIDRSVHHSHVGVDEIFVGFRIGF